MPGRGSFPARRCDAASSFREMTSIFLGAGAKGRTVENVADREKFGKLARSLGIRAPCARANDHTKSTRAQTVNPATRPAEQCFLVAVP